MDELSHRAGVDDVIITDELTRRPSRPPDLETENRALTALAAELAERPRNVLQKLTDLIVELGIGQSAGVSVAEGSRLRWAALSGGWSRFKDGTIASDASPSGVALSRDAMLLVEHPERAFPEDDIEPRIQEALVIPFHSAGRPVGTLWILSHEAGRVFDGEDARILKSLSRYAAAARHTIGALEEAESLRRESDARLNHVLEILPAGDIEALEKRAEALSESEERQRFLLRLSDRIRPLADAGEIKNVACRLLGPYLGACRVNYFDIEGDRFVADVGYVDGVKPIMSGFVADYGEVFLRGFRDNEMMVSTDLASDDRFSDAERKTMRAAGIGAFVALMIVRDGQWVASFSVHSRSPREWTRAELELVRDVGERIRDSAQRGRAEEAEKEAEARLRAMGERYQMLFDTIDQGFCTIEVLFDDQDRPVDYRFLELNPAFEAQTGLQDAAGKWMRALRPDHEAFWFETYGKVALTGEPARFEHEAAALGRWYSVYAFRIGKPEQRRVAILFEDISERKASQQALEVSEQRVRTLLTGIPQLVFRALSGGERIWVSRQWVDYTGISFEQGIGYGWQKAVHPDDLEATMAAWKGVEARGEYYVEHRLRKKETGEYRWHQTRATPLRAEDGSIIEWLGTSTDVEEMRRLHRREQLLVGELQHRVRNTLAVVRSIVRRTSQAATSAEEMASHLAGRLDAFSRVQSAVTRSPEGGVGLASLVEDALLALAAREGEALRISGPDISLRSKPAEILSLAVHELATNAVKYGALCDPLGRIVVEWQRDRDKSGEEQLQFTWTEFGLNLSGGEPQRHGFGLELLRRGLPYELGGTTKTEWRPQGLRFTLRMPIGPDILAD